MAEKDYLFSIVDHFKSAKLDSVTQGWFLWDVHLSAEG